MQKSITPARIRNAVRLNRSLNNCAIIVVEDNAHSKILNKFISKENCHIEIAWNRDRVSKSLQLIYSDGIKGVIGFIDADFSILEGTPQSTEGIFRTDSHDMETMMLKSRALINLLNEFGSPIKLEKNEGQIEKTLLDIGKHIGYLRWLNEKEQLFINFENADFERFIDKSTLILDEFRMIEIFIQNSKKPKTRDYNILLKKVNAIKDAKHDLWQVCCGHDLASILSIALRKVWGSCDKKEVKEEILARGLRLAYEFAFFKDTMLFSLLIQWQTNNEPYVIFEQEDLE